MSPGPDPIEAYLAELAQTLGRFSRGRRRLLAEAEDHLHEAADRHRETGASQHDAELAAVAQLGPPGIVAAADPRRRLVIAMLGGAALTAVAATAAVLAAARSHDALGMIGSGQLVPPSIARDLGPARPIPPDARIDATARLVTGATYALVTYRSRGWRCEATFIIGPSGLAATHGLGGSSSCLPPGAPFPPVDLGVESGSTQGVVLAGTAPLAADGVLVTTASGRVRMFPLPHIALYSDPARQAVIVDRSAAHIRRVAHVALRFG
jgi:hypothetical protein